VWRDKKVTVILPTYNEKDSIRQCIEDFFDCDVVDEVLVVNNNAAPGTDVEVAKTRARQVFETRQGYGFAIQRGFAEASGELLVVCEPDATFLPRDIYKLLAYADDFEVVYGSRTARMFIWRGANMGWFLRWGNWAVAKLMEFLFNATNLTDVGCTMRLVHRGALQRIQPHFTIGGSAFGPEMMLLSLIMGLKVIQIPVNYLPRVGESSVTGDLRKAFLLGVSMIALVLRYRLLGLRKAGPGLRRGQRPTAS
jgi:glycosyltransferase involved in cell wall biosynthesis